MTAPLPHITILMATFNGAEHLGEQLASIADQTHGDWGLWVSDDGSTDDTLLILQDFADAHPARDIRILTGPRAGAAANFLSLLCHPELPDGPVALSDQDDIWRPEKITKALNAIAPLDGVAVYSAQSRHIRGDGSAIGNSRPHQGPPSFGNALVQNRVAGHCAVLTPGAVRAVRAAKAVDVPFHDWWIYMVVTGVGGRVVVSRDIVLDYRQHGGNVLGGNRRRLAGLARIAMLFGSTFSRWHTANLAALTAIRPQLTDTAKTTLDNWQTAPKSGRGRIRVMRQLGIRRDSSLATSALYLAAFLGRV